MGKMPPKETGLSPQHRSDWTVQQWTDYAKAGNKYHQMQTLRLQASGVQASNLQSYGMHTYGGKPRRCNLRDASLEDAELWNTILRNADLQ